jgi:hypothetical protein
LKVSAKDNLVPGDTLFLPVNIQESSVAEKTRKFDNRNEIEFLRSLEIYKVLIYSVSKKNILIGFDCKLLTLLFGILSG